MATSFEAEYHFAVCGHHIYKDIWVMSLSALTGSSVTEKTTLKTSKTTLKYLLRYVLLQSSGSSGPNVVLLCNPSFFVQLPTPLFSVYHSNVIGRDFSFWLFSERFYVTLNLLPNDSLLFYQPACLRFQV